MPGAAPVAVGAWPRVVTYPMAPAASTVTAAAASQAPRRGPRGDLLAEGEHAVGRKRPFLDRVP